ncbi:hypothetical protein ABMA28_001853 [Loxostege sticticalis]|uniref:Riboflavin transporter n=1 Tax=Loxostege sticticalis TaxID=481309 RepID=A0ABD0SYX3_LOXSC
MAEITRVDEDREYSPCLGEGDSEANRIKMFGVKRRIALDVLMACWGLGTWLGVNGLYVQLPLLVERLPEGWALPSSMTVAIASANVGLLLYALLKRFVARVPDTAYIYGLLSVGLTALLLNSFLYTETAPIGGSDRSIAFLTLTFFTGLVGCTSSVLFYPYLRHFRDIYLTTYLVGEGLSGFIPSILALVQGVGGEPDCVPSADNSTLVPVYPPPRFDSTVFILLLAVLAALSLVSFALVDRCSAFNAERVAPSAVAKDDEAETQRESLLRPNWIGVMAMMACLNALMNGVLPSVQSYSCMPYGTQTYHLAVSLSTMANPLACLAGVWLRPVPSAALAAALAVTAVPFAYILTTALMSPAPPLLNTAGGDFLVIISWVVVMGVVSYARMWVYGWARRGGARGMRACGAVTQAGSAAGSITLFFIVNYTGAFTQPDACPPISI